MTLHHLPTADLLTLARDLSAAHRGTDHGTVLEELARRFTHVISFEKGRWARAGEGYGLEEVSEFELMERAGVGERNRI